MRKIFVASIMIACCFGVMGCSPTNRVKQEIPEAKYTEAGYGVISEIEEDGTVKITYALVGLKNDEINYLYLDQIEQNPTKDRFLFTNKELQSAYGLSYKSDHGEWYQQVDALEKYIAGHHMTIRELNEIETYKKDEEHPKAPKKGSDLEAGCELDLTDFIQVINLAYENTTKVEANRLGVGEDIRVKNSEGKLEVTLAFVATDYRYKICYSHLDSYVVTAEQGKIRSLRDETANYEQTEQWKDGLDAYEKYINGLNMVEAYGVETYDPGDGISTALPKPGTDLAEVCNIDLDKFIKVLEEAAGRLR